MFRHGACMHALTFEVCFIYHQGLSVIALEARSVEAPVGKSTTSGAPFGIYRHAGGSGEQGYEFKHAFDKGQIGSSNIPAGQPNPIAPGLHVAFVRFQRFQHCTVSVGAHTDVTCFRLFRLFRLLACPHPVST